VDEAKAPRPAHKCCFRRSELYRVDECVRHLLSGTGALRAGLDFRSHAAGGSSDLGGPIGIPPPENSKAAQRILFAGDPYLASVTGTR
jgi:hypothetical protein